MQSPPKDWLVRTKTGEILGPFTQRELMDELRKRTFGVEDEIAQSRNMWISAQTLSAHEPDEFTLTHTRNQTAVTQTTNTDTLSKTQDLPNPRGDKKGDLPISTKSEGEKVLANGLFSGSKPGPTIVIVVATLVTLIIGMQLRKRHKNNLPPQETPVQGNHSVSVTDSPFVKQIYGMINQGDTQTALRELNQYHENHPSSAAPDYLIPYAQLLITEGDSPGRARKFLEQVVKTESATAYDKARAHHWLGYIQLSEGSGDMGEQHFIEALRLDSTHSASLFNLGRTYLKQKKFAQALESLNRLTADPADNWLIYIYKGRAKAALGDMDEARTSFRLAMERSPDRWITYLYYAIFLSATREHRLAQDVMRKMLLRDPQFESDSPAPVGYFQEKVGWAEYLDTYLQIMDDADSEVRDAGKLYLSYLLSNNGASEGKRLEAFGERSGPLARFFALKSQLDRDAPSRVLATTVEKMNGNLKDLGYYAYVLRAEAQARLNHSQEANKDYQAAMTLEPQAAITHWSYSLFLRKAQRLQDASNELKRLLSYHPRYIPAIVSAQKF